MTLDEIEEKIRTLCGSAPTQDGHVRGDVEAACNIAMALVAHVRALENVTRMTDDRAFERITALEAKVAALGQLKTFIEVFRDGNAELVRLRVENAELRKVNANVHHVAAEYEERIAALEERDRLRTKTVEEQPQWPAPQPIETAPLGEILAGPAPNGFAWAPERPLAGCSLESWRTQLREAERRWWLHMPPPPGGGK